MGDIGKIIDGGKSKKKKEKSSRSRHASDDSSSDSDSMDDTTRKVVGWSMQLATHKWDLLGFAFFSFS